MRVHRPTYPLIATLTAVAALAFTGCGGDDSGAPAEPTTAPTLEAPTAPGVVGGSPFDDDDDDRAGGTGGTTGATAGTRPGSGGG
jgi:hypothetical protein